jgi:hypothetical protein
MVCSMSQKRYSLSTTTETESLERRVEVVGICDYIHLYAIDFYLHTDEKFPTFSISIRFPNVSVNYSFFLSCLPITEGHHCPLPTPRPFASTRIPSATG